MTHSGEVRARIRALVTVAFDAVPPVWPLGGFIATNPLGGLEHRPFADAVASMRAQTGARGYLSDAEYRTRFVAGSITDEAFEAALDDALQGMTTEKKVICGRSIGVRDIVRISLLRDLAGECDRRDLSAAAASRVPVHRNFVHYSQRREKAECVETRSTLGELVDDLCAANVVELIDERTSMWCAAFLDQGEATWPMPYRALGFYVAWRRLAPYESHLRVRSAAGPHDARIRRPETFARPEDAIVAALSAMGVERAAWKDYFARHALRLPGWAGVAKWRAARPHDPAQQIAAIDPVQYLAVRLSYEAALVHTLADRHGIASTEAAFAERFGPPPSSPAGTCYADVRNVLANLAAALDFNETDVLALEDDELQWLLEAQASLGADERGGAWLCAAERTMRAELLGAIERKRALTTGAAAADVVFCIDVRSEGFRRHLESAGPYRTRGFAGFYGLPIALQSIGSDWLQQACPVLLSPKHRIVERITASSQSTKRHERAHSVMFDLRRILDELKGNAASAFILFESIGVLFALPFAGRTLAPRIFAGLTAAVRRALVSPVQTTFTIEKTPGDDAAIGFTPAERVFFAESALSLMGLREGFARIVLLAGHGSTTENNPFEASLDCGACAGYRGGPNARILAALLNREDVRAGLVERGIIIPMSTVFVGAEHDTATDCIRVFDGERVPASHRVEVAALQRDLDLAGLRLAEERACGLGRASKRLSSADVAARAVDWAQVRPEWGLARNAAFVIAPRSFTAGANLDTRAFLHEYDVDNDPNGTLLEIIMTAPLVVAQWINNHYYFATVDNERYGSGTKVVHNVVGRIGVMSGNRGDLRAGLPLQSLADAAGWYHDPVRLLAIVTAPRARIEAVIGRNELLRRLFHNEWIALTAFDPETNSFWDYTPEATWQPQTSHSTGTAQPAGATIA